MKKYILTRQAEKDIDDIADYIFERSPKASLAVYNEIQRTCMLIGDLPQLGHPVEDIGADELFQLAAGKYKNYLVIYIIKESIPIMVRVIHAKRDNPDHLMFFV